MSTEIKSPKEAKKRSVVSAKRMDRAFRVFDLRRSGGSFRAISLMLKDQAEKAGESTRGYSHNQIRDDFALAIDLKADELGDMVAEARILTAERLNEIYLRIGPLLTHSKPSVKLKAANVLIRANKEFAELHGAKRPQKIDVTGNIGLDWSTLAREAKEPKILTDED